jgi:flagellar biosynthetic protein FlhB
LKSTLGGLIANAHRLRTDGYGLSLLAGQLSVEVLAALAIPLLLLALAAIAGNIIQHRLVWSAEGLKPKLEKISPVAGARRLFSKQALANFVKGLAKLAIIGTVMALVLWPERGRLDSFVRIDPAALLGISKSLALQLLGVVVALLAIIAGADFMFQYRQWHQRHKMSVREMKEEFRQTEGDPAVKARIRRIRETKMRKRMMAAVPEATVIITNPTHFAVALKYERGDNAPLCVAKGMDAIALKMREVAKEHNVPVVENPPLARTLHATVQIDQEIPPEHYKAVAEVIGYVMRLRQGLTRH